MKAREVLKLLRVTRQTLYSSRRKKKLDLIKQDLEILDETP